MKLIRPFYLEGYIISLVLHDLEIAHILVGWEIEKTEVWNLLIEHYNDIGLFTIQPTHQAEIFRKDLIHQLHHSKEIRRRREQIRSEIAKVREKNRARAEDGSI